MTIDSEARLCVFDQKIYIFLTFKAEELSNFVVNLKIVTNK